MKTTTTIQLTSKEIGKNIIGLFPKKISLCNEIHRAFVFSHQSYTGATSYYFVTREAYLKYGGAQKAAVYGKEGIDYKEFASTQALNKHLNKFVKTLIEA